MPWDLMANLSNILIMDDMKLYGKNDLNSEDLIDVGQNFQGYWNDKDNGMLLTWTIESVG